MTALITGASSGIGYELARIIAHHGHDVVIVARDVRRLEAVADELRSNFNVNVLVRSADLADAGAPLELYAYVKESGWSVDMLINNAGFGVAGRFAETRLSTELALLQVNIVSLVHLTKLFLADMLERRSGRVLNVASTAAFQPGPTMAVYYASKAFVLSFSQAIRNELADTGVSVTTLCPGPTASKFHERAGSQSSKLVTWRVLGFPSAASVAEAGYDGMMRGRSLVVPGIMNKVGVQLTRITPRGLAAQVTRLLQEGRH